jgi:DNA-binding NarL/FixJ family response regulator
MTAPAVTQAHADPAQALELAQGHRPDDDATDRDRTEERPVRDDRPSLLIADDDPLVRYVLRAQLEDSYRIVALAADATEAVALAEEHRPDAALIDVEMPAGGAREAVPRIAACSPHTSIVILSADESRHVVLELLRAGAMAYVRKGVSGDHISQALAGALSRPARTAMVASGGPGAPATELSAEVR